ncbi:hypothetical protein HZS_6781 [Henneguya salminicola]|nr:hypothetical protein HZS_6781 [Henneguya salminicola]
MEENFDFTKKASLVQKTLIRFGCVKPYWSFSICSSRPSIRPRCKRQVGTTAQIRSNVGLSHTKRRTNLSLLKMLYHKGIGSNLMYLM